MDHKYIQFENGQYNATHISSLTLEQFTKENAGNQFARHGEGENAKLKEVYDACCAACPKEATKPAKPTASAAKIEQ